jgi:HEPN domain-containing protein/predicted nucleotidyltransferase
MIENQDATLSDLTHALVDRFAPERILLFGSRARGDHHPESDYDVMVVLSQSPQGKPAEHSEDVVRRAAQDIRPNVDVFVDTSEQFERRRTDVGTLEFAADHEGRVLYMRTSASEPRHVRETPLGPPESLKEWIARAQSDFTAMTELARSGAPGIRDAIVFHAHQGVEKMLKAVLVARHVPPPRTHDLTQLLPRLPIESRDDPRLDEACRGLHALWPNSRYPREAVPTTEQVDQAVGWARRAREIVSAVIPV